ncbi:hypothetical protein OIU35_18055 [Boseaceae bacterium BT-24-1]|nr:hypothetical protein [Boseaceae bacterium BT-24-1]
MSDKIGLLWVDPARLALIKELEAAPFPGLNRVEREFARESIRRAQRNQKIRFAVAATLIALTLTSIAAAIYATIQKDAATSLLNTAIKEASERLLQVGQTKLTDDPATSIRLAEAASRLNPTLAPAEIRALLTNAAHRNPVWARVPSDTSAKDGSNIFPPVYEQKQVPFAVNRTFSHALLRDAGIGRGLALYDLDSATIVARLDLRSGKLIDEEPYSRDIIGVLHSSPESRLEIYDLSVSGLASPAAIVPNAMLMSCANGSWPCAAIKQDGSVILLNKTPSSSIDIKEIGRWQHIVGASLHPTGRALILKIRDQKALWIGDLAESTKPSERWLELKSHAAYLYEELFPWIAWGPAPSQFIALDISESTSSGWAPNAVATLSAHEALSDRKLVLRQVEWRHSGIGRQALASDQGANRIIWIRTDQSRGMVPEVITIEWPGNPAAPDEVAKLVQDRDSGLLHGDLPATATANVQAVALSANGNFALVANDIRGTSGTQAGVGRLESWNLTLLPENTPDAAEFLVPNKAHAVKIAYSQDSSRIAVLDALGSVSIYRVRTSPPPILSTGLRIPEDLYERLTPDVRSAGQNRRFWLVRYSGNDHRLYDLLNSKENKLETILGKRIISAAFSGDNLDIVTINSIVRFRDGAITSTRALATEAAKAYISDTVISVQAASRFSFFSRSTFAELGSADIDDGHPILGAFPDDEVDSYRPSVVVGFPEHYSAGNKLTMRFVSNWTLHFWETEIQPKLEFRQRWKRELPSQFTNNRWSSLRRSHGSDTDLLLVGSNNPDEFPILMQLNATSGAAKEHFVIPPQATANGRRIFEIVNAMPLSNSRVAVLFRFYPAAFAVGVWRAGGGEVLKWQEVAAEMDEEVVDVRAGPAGENEMLVVVRGSSDKRNGNFRLLSILSGVTLWSGEFDHLLAPPYLAPASGRWQVVNEAAWQQAARTVLTGGGSLGDRITRIQLNPEERRRIDSLGER